VRKLCAALLFVLGLAACGGVSEPAARHQGSSVTIITLCSGPTYVTGKHGHSHVEKGTKGSCSTKARGYNLSQSVTAVGSGNLKGSGFVFVSLGGNGVLGEIERFIERLLHP
jgi:hypothetical protein